MRLSLVFLCVAAAVPACLAQSYLVGTFTNRSKDPNLDWVGESLSEATRDALAASGISVATREDREEAVRRLALRPSSQLTLASLTKLGAELEAQRLVYGRFDVVPDRDAPSSRGRIRVLARVLNLTDAVPLTEFVVTGLLEDLGAVRGDLAWQVLRWAQPSSTLSREQFRERHPPVKVNALEYYIRGLIAPTAESAHRLLTQAARLDPTFSAPRFHLGRMHFEKENYREAASWLEMVPSADPRYIEANFLLGLCSYELSEFAASRRAFEKVAAAVPAAEVWNNLGAADARLNRPEALEYFEKARKADSKDPDYHFNAGYVLWKRGSFDEAAERFSAVLDRTQDDEDAIVLLERCRNRVGPRRGEVRTEGLERLKDSYSEPAAKPASTASVR